MDKRMKHKFIPYGFHSIKDQDINAVMKVLRCGSICLGPKIAEFERKLARYCGSRHAVAVSSGTAALHLACLAAGLKKGEEAITSPVTFVATPNSVLYSGASPVFADINYDTVNIDPRQVEKKVTSRTRAILPVHLGGLPCEMQEIHRIARQNNLTVIEDACHALGAKYRVGRSWVKVGSCRHSDMAVFSFFPVKHITTGEGGAITTNNRELCEKLIALRSHGVYRDAGITRKWPWYYEMRELGFNYRISDFQCALGISQLKRAEGFLKRRRAIAERYHEFFRNIDGIETQHIKNEAMSSWHLFIVKIDYRRFGLTRAEFMEKLKKNGIGSQVHYIPVYRQPFYRKNFGFPVKDYPNAELYYQRALSLPIFPDLSDQDVQRVINAFKCIVS